MNISFITPGDYGAIGDGVNDDTEAFQAALDACGSDYCDLYIPSDPRKRYRITSTLIIRGNLRLKRFLGDADFRTGTINTGAIIWDVSL